MSVFSIKSTNFALMLVKTEAIVLHSFKLGENKIVVDLLTLSNGRMSVVAPLSRTVKAKIKKQLFLPLAILEITAEVRKTNMPKLLDVHILHPFSTIPFEPYKLSISLFLAEFLYRSMRVEQQDEPLYAYIKNSILWLDGCIGGFSNFHLVFTLRLVRFLGFYPNLEEHTEGAFFDMRSGCFTSVVPMHRDFLQPREASLIILMMRMDFFNMHLFNLSRAQRNSMIDVILHYYRLHLPDFPELKSLGVLRELF